MSTRRDNDIATPSGLPHLFADHPVKSEQVAFDFKGFAKTLAGLALNPANHTPFTVVVRGSWGRGKTTLLLQTKRIVEAQGGEKGELKPGMRRVKPLWFNAWKCPQEDTVLAGLLGALLDEFRNGDLGRQAARFIDEHKEWAVGLFLKKAFPYFFDDGLPESRYSGVESKRAFYDTFEELFRQLGVVWFRGWKALGDNFGARLNSENEVIAVFLDDLDRCRPERVLEVLEAINLFLDMPGVCFFLGLDWQRTLDALAEKKKDPARFLEKIVQVAIDLPPVPEPGAAGFLKTLLATSPHRGLFERRHEAVARALENLDPRHVKRFVNDLSIRLALLENTNRLGDADDRIPPRAVVAWHLVLEALKDDARRVDLASLSKNVEGLLRRYRAWRDTPADEPSEHAKGVDREPASRAQTDPDAALFESQRDAFEDLLKLEEAQLDHLVHLGSPPRVQTVAEAPGPAGVGEPDEMRRRGRTGAAAGATGLEWVRLPAGVFEMGSTKGDPEGRPVHTVRLSEFEMAKFPVTNAQYAAFVSSGKATPPSHWTNGEIPRGKDQHPVANVTWNDALSYCRWISDQAGSEIRLPTEAQWEYAARGSSGREYPWGDDPPTAERANFGGAVGDTSAVGSYPAGKTPEGLFDLAGNVWEWCADWFGAYSPDEVTDPTGPASGTRRVVRGGSFYLNPRYLRAACRDHGDPGYAYDVLGFRCVRVAPGGQQELGS